tara:strand:- start:10217 stop:10846 length:630 start_codon:yes stop_codon:yes gene_type:complete
MSSYVYLKLNAFAKGSTDLTTDTIPLRINNLSISVSRQVLDFTIPLSSIATGESLTVGADFGAAEKTISLSGFITDANITKSHTSGSVFFTAQEIAQMIAASVDSSSIAKYQNFNELVILIPSNVDSSFVDRDSASGVGSRGDLIPFTFSARGEANDKDNERVPFPFNFPDTQTADGISGYIQSFNFTLSGETTEVEFSMEFKQANIFP